MILFRAILACGFLLAIAARAELRDGLVAYWPCDQIGGKNNTTPDRVGDRDLAYKRWRKDGLVDGRHGKALAFKEDWQYLLILHTNDAKLPISMSPNFTIALWVQAPPNQTNRVLFSEAVTRETATYFLLSTDPQGKGAKLTASLVYNGTNNTITSHENVFDTLWHHVAWIKKDNRATLYIDGSPDAVMENYGNPRLSCNAFSIAAFQRNHASHFLVATIDEIAIWNRALDEKELELVINNMLGTSLRK